MNSFKYPSFIKPGILILVGLLLFFRAYAQKDKEVVINKVIREILKDAPADLDYSELYDKFSDLYDHPLSLNAATKEDLSGLYFLNELQMNDLIAYREKYGVFKTLFELKSIRSLDVETINKLVIFTTIEINVKKNLPFTDYVLLGNNQLQLRFGTIVERQKGYPKQGSPVDSAQNHYLGSPYRLFLRYTHKTGNFLSYGITAEKDPGEEFYKGSQKQGFDFYSAHIFISGWKKIKALALGDYLINAGQGLVFWSGLSYRAAGDYTSVFKSGPVIKPYHSSNEYNFLRGSAITYEIDKFQMTVFYSNKQIDAALKVNDSSADIVENSFTTCYFTGYHRTAEELLNKKTVSEQIAGTHLSMNSEKIKLGMTTIHGWYSQPQEQKTRLSDYYDFTGKSFTDFGLDYSIPFKSLFIFGETGFDGSTFANISGILVDFNSNITGSLVYRNYPAAYKAIYANAFRAGGSTGNEKGICLTLLFQISNKIKISGYIDQFYFPWLKYNVDNPSEGNQCLIQAQYIQANTSMKLRTKYDRMEINLSGSESTLKKITEINKYNFNYKIETRLNDRLLLGSEVIYGIYDNQMKEKEQGLITNQDFTTMFFKNKLLISAGFCLFNTESYNSALCIYEDNIPGESGTSVLYDKGTKYYILLRYQTGGDKIKCYLKIGRIAFFNKTTVGSGLDEITGNHKTDIRLAFYFRI